jgi:hypothetical protein
MLVADTCEEVDLYGGERLYVVFHPNATTRTDVQQGECSADSILGEGKWSGLDGNGLNWRVVMSEMGNAKTEAIVLEGNCNDLRCVASSKDSDQGNNNQVTWEAQNGTNYYIFTSGTSETEDSLRFRTSLEVRPLARFKFLLTIRLLYFCHSSSCLTNRHLGLLSFQPADSLSVCKNSVLRYERSGSESCTCDGSSLTVSCDATCDTCLGSSCGEYSWITVFDPDVDEPVVWDQSCLDIQGQVFCYAYSPSTCEISVDGVSCSSCKLCGINDQIQVCADCTNIQPGAVINEVEGTGLVGIFSEPLVQELFNNYENVDKWEDGSNCRSSPTVAPTHGPTTPAPVTASLTPTTKEPTPAPSSSSAALIRRTGGTTAMLCITAVLVAFQILASLL